MILQLAVGYALHSFQDQHGEIFLHNFWDLTSFGNPVLVFIAIILYTLGLVLMFFFFNVFTKYGFENVYKGKLFYYSRYPLKDSFILFGISLQILFPSSYSFIFCLNMFFLVAVCESKLEKNWTDKYQNESDFFSKYPETIFDPGNIKRIFK